MIVLLLVPLLVLVAIACVALGYMAAYGQRRGDQYRRRKK